MYSFGAGATSNVIVFADGFTEYVLGAWRTPSIATINARLLVG